MHSKQLFVASMHVDCKLCTVGTLCLTCLLTVHAYLAVCVGMGPSSALRFFYLFNCRETLDLCFGSF